MDYLIQRSTLDKVFISIWCVVGFTSRFPQKFPHVTKSTCNPQCRAVSAVVIGDPESFQGVPVSWASRWQHLKERSVDLVILGDTHTVEREVEEVRTYYFVALKLQNTSSHCNQHPPELQSSTGSGFTFSVPFFYDGLTFVGNDTFVRCAEEKQRHGTCSSLSICVEAGTTWYIYLERVFPSNYIKVGSSLKQNINMMLNNECNVIASEESIIRSVALLDGSFHHENFTMGTKRLTKEPHGILTNNHDREFSDIVNWVVQALFFGEKEGLEKDLRRCRNNTAATPHHVSDLRFLNAVFCVGNYEEIMVGNMGNPHQRGRNALNHGSGMLYAIPFHE